MNTVIRCSIRSRQQEGSCNSCQRRDRESVILVELNTMTFRVCSRCAKELVDKITALSSRWVSVEDRLPDCPGNSFDKEWIVTDGTSMYKTSQHPLRWNKKFPRCTCGQCFDGCVVTHWMET